MFKPHSLIMLEAGLLLPVFDAKMQYFLPRLMHPVLSGCSAAAAVRRLERPLSVP